MTLRLVDSAWGTELTEALRADTSALRVICPFIKTGAVDRLLALKPKTLQAITRFNLADFVNGVSDIVALRKVLAAGGQVRGIKNLHAKLYLLGASRAIVTSANLTGAALDRNAEFGAVLDGAADVATCRDYFDRLWQLGAADLDVSQLDDWAAMVARHQASGARPATAAALPDFGASAPAVAMGTPDPAGQPVAVAEAGRAFVKFLGTSSNREPLSLDTLIEIKRAGGHWALAYPAAQRPRAVRDGDVMFIARLTRDPNDMRIFGRAMGMAYMPGRDDATPQDQQLRPWKAQWSRYIRVHHAEFVAGPLANGVSLNELMDALGADAFESPQQHAAAGEGNTNPRAALMRKAAVQLSGTAMGWLNGRLQHAFDIHGKVPQDSLDRLDWPVLP